MSQRQLTLVGGFVVVGVLLFTVGIFMIGDRRLLFTDHFEVNADFGNVTGVQIGTLVRVAGLDAGEVLRIEIPSSPTERFVVGMRVREELRPLVRTDSVAALLTDGLLGNVFVQIREGSDAASMVEPQGRLRGVDAIEVADLITEGRDTFRTLAAEFIELRQDFGQTVDQLRETVRTTTLLMNDVGNDVRTTSTMSALFMDEARGLAANSRQILADLQAGEGTVGKLLTDDELYARAAGVAAEMEATMVAARGVTEHTQAILDDFRNPGGPRDELWTGLRELLGTAQNAVSDLAENTEALKHNWLVRGFFNDRGFFNLDAMTVEEYRELIRRDSYTPLQVWAEADGLFIDDDGTETLSEAGRRRLDSAMGDFLRFPRSSPLVVEGYATAGTRGDQFRRSDARASAVRAYLVNVFGRVATLTGTMPVGADAAGSPRPDGTWDGIALTLLVRPDAVPAVRAGE